MAKKSQPQSKPLKPRELVDIVREIAVYPEEAYEFVQLGLQYTVQLVGKTATPEDNRHVTGQQLSVGLRHYAWERWGMLARSVLQRWNITSTMDFGKIVYALIEGGVLAKNDDDRLEDFRSVYDFRTLESEYQVECGARPAVCAGKTAGQALGGLPGGGAAGEGPGGTVL